MKEPSPSYTFAYEPVGHEPGFDPCIFVGKRTLTRLIPPHRERATPATAVARSASLGQPRERADAAQATDAPQASDAAHATDGTHAPIDDPFWFAEGTERPPAGALADRGARLPGQMDKDHFLAELREAVEEVATRVLGPTWSLARCPDIPRFFARQARMPAARVEALMRRYTRTESLDARDYIEAVRNKLPSALRRWASSQDPSLTWEPGASGLPVALERDDGPPESGARFTDPAQWGAGTALDDETRARMESRLGDTLGDVQLHHSGALSDLASSSGKDAVAAGRHVGFAPGAYDAGTPASDALLAHELAHLIQQRNAVMPEDRPVPMGSDHALEDDADRAAADGARPSLRSPVVVRGGNKPEGSPPPRRPSKEPEKQISQAPIQIAAIDPRLHVEQLQDLVKQFVKKTGGSDFSDALWKLVATAPDDGLVDATCWNAIIELLIARAEAFEHDEFVTKKPKTNSTPDTYGSRRATDFEIQLCLELICALGSKWAPIGGKAVPYGTVIPILYNKAGINTGTKDPNSKTDQFLLLPLDQVKCPFLDSNNYLHDVDVLSVHFERTGRMIRPGFTTKLFCEEDQIRLLRFPRIRSFFECKLLSLQTSKVCPSPPVLQCILDIGGALTGGKLSPTQHKATFSQETQRKLGKAQKKRFEGGDNNEDVYSARRMRLMHHRREDLQILLTTTCKQDVWVLETKYYVKSDLKWFWATLDEVIEEAMKPTDMLGFTGTCQGGMGSSTIDWCLSMMEKRAKSGDTSQDLEYLELGNLFMKVDKGDDCIKMFEIKLPMGMSIDDLKVPEPEPEPIIVESSKSFDQTVTVKGIHLNLFSTAFEQGKKPTIEPSDKVRFERKGGGSYVLSAIAPMGSSWASHEYTFELVGETKSDTNMSAVDTISGLLERDDIEGACLMLVSYEGLDWGSCASKLVQKVYAKKSLYVVVLTACATLSAERLVTLVEAFLFWFIGDDNEKELKAALIAALKQLNLYTTPIQRVFFPRSY